jgi:Na+/phosphate symporter
MDNEIVGGVQDIDRVGIVEMSEGVVTMLRRVRDAFHRLNAAPLEDAGRMGRQVHRQEHALIDHMVKRATEAGAAGLNEEAVFVPMHLERIADNIELLAASTGRMVREGILFTDRATREIGGLFDTAVELLEGLRDAARTGNRTLIRYVLDASRTCETRANEYALFHEQRLIEGVCVPRASSVYLAMLDHLKGVEWHARQIAEKLQPLPVAIRHETHTAPAPR